MIPAFAPPRQEPSLYPVRFDRTARFHELGPGGEIARTTVLRWFEQARRAVETRAFGPDRPVTRPPLSAVRVEMLGPVPAGASYEIGAGVATISAASFTCTYGLFRDGECVALGESASMHSRDGMPAELPGDVRHRLAAIGGTRIPGRDVERDPARLVRDAYPFGVDVRARFGELDTGRTVGNVALAGWYLDVLAELHLDVLGHVHAQPVGSTLDLLAPRSLSVGHLADVIYPGTYRVQVGVLDVDDTSVHYACGLFEGVHCVGLAEAIGTHAVAAAVGRGAIELADRFDRLRMRR
ncbi:acyl-CoA thioesterase [Pseudonocardia sp.]|jgi:acyl-CoA thioester hydrolase|uniref:acyl-CoA thioesterase n=1 Tax=Pseudonocardia sp. TaxID=60912 RepID=UPI003D0BBF42